MMSKTKKTHEEIVKELQIDINEDDVITEETIKELSNGKGEDEDE